MILLTRPYKDSIKLAEKLGKENCIIEPMIEIRELNFKVNNKSQAIVSTSNNVNHKADVKIPDNGKNAQEILQYCLDNLKPDNGEIIYLSGDKISLDIAEELRKNGYDTKRIIAYNQMAIIELSHNFLANFEKIKTATFFSKNTLKNFLQLANNYNLETHNITCLCISKEVAAETSASNWKSIKTAKQPNLNSMCAIISEYHDMLI